MQFYIAVAYNDPTHLTELARAAEEAGFGGIVISDHLVHPAPLETRYPYSADGTPPWEIDTPWPDPFVAIGAMAAVTRTLRFITSVFVLPLRHPVLAAKTIATASLLSQGRLSVGIGAGWMREEFEILGAAFEGRGRRMDEALRVMRTLWQGGVVEHHGEFYDFGPLQMSPAPGHRVPIYAGGESEVALRRAAATCDGWASQESSRASVARAIARLRSLRAESERADEPLRICAAVRDAYDPDGYHAMRDLGVDELITVPWLFYGADPASCQQKCDGIRRFGEDVIAKLDL